MRLLTPMRSLRVDIPIKHVAIHKKVRVRPHAGRRASTHPHHSVQSVISASLGIRLGALAILPNKYSIVMLYITPESGGHGMEHKRLRQIEKRIARIKEALGEIGPMRPGSLTEQFKDRENEAGAFWQLSYTRQMHSRTDYIRREWVKATQQQIKEYKKFKRLIEAWVALAIEHATLRMKIEKLKPKK
jgi:hypothetical protein